MRIDQTLLQVCPITLSHSKLNIIRLAVSLLLSFSLALLSQTLEASSANDVDQAIELSDEEASWLKSHPVISVAYDGFFPPYSFKEEGHAISGFSVELFKIFEKKLGVEFKPHTEYHWKSLYEDAKKNRVDIVATMVNREERKEWFSFTAPYIQKSLVIITQDDNLDIDSKFDLKGKKVALVKDYQYAKRIMKEFPTIDPLEVDTMLDALNAVSVGEADAAVSFIGAGHFYRTKYLISNLKYAAIYDSKGAPESIAVRKDWPILNQILSKALNSIPEAKIQALRAKWLPVDYLNANYQIQLSPKQRAWLDQHSEIKLGVDPEFAPFEFIEKGQYQGLASDYIKLLNQRLNINMEVVPNLSWTEATTQAKNKQLDILPAVGVTQERKKYFNYTRPYLSFHRVIVTQTDFPFISGLNDLSNHRLAVQANSSHYGFVTEQSDIKPITYKTLNEALLALSGGEVDAFVGNVASTSYWIRKLNLTNLKVAAPVSKEKQSLHFAVRKDWPELIEILTAGLNSITPTEEEAIRRKWTSVKVDTTADYTIIIRITFIFLVVVVLVIFWNVMLNRKVKLQTSQILHSTHYDQLTDLPNHFLIQDLLSQSIDNANEGEVNVALLSIDLDEFKNINDSHGHRIGDQVLQQVALRLNQVLRKGEILGRLSGDQFLILMSDFQHASDLATATDNIIHQFKLPFEIDNKSFQLSASVGISIYPFDGLTPDELLKNADSATHFAKEMAKGSYAFFTEERKKKISRQLELEEGLRHALSNQELSMVYQPKVDAQSKTVQGFEALLRWNSNNLGSVSPAEFIPIAEKTGAIIPIGEFVITQSTRDIVALRERFGRHCSIAINISPTQFESLEMIDVLKKSISRNQLEPQAVEVEITEGVLMSTQSNTDFVLNSLLDMGVQLAMDDFGQGYSSMSNLRKFKFHTVKIDREFISELPNDISDCKLVSATISMAHGLGMKVVAEGVETEEQSRFLVESDCDTLQGWHYGKPHTLNDILRHEN